MTKDPQGDKNKAVEPIMDKVETPELTNVHRIDYLFKIIGRFDFYINSTNTKASLILAWNGIVFGTMLLKYDEIMKLYPLNWPRNFAVGLFCLIGTASMVSNGFVFKVIFPFLLPTSDSKKKQERKQPMVPSEGSILFFGTVATMGREKFTKKVTSYTSQDYITDMSDQGVTLAKGLLQKMETLERSIQYIYIQLFLLACLSVLLAVVSWIK